MMTGRKLCLEDEFARVTDYFAPRIIGAVNDVFIKLVKTKGDAIPWHSHEGEDELFLIIRGSLTLEIKDEPPVILRPNELFIVRRGVEHRVYSEGECWHILVEPKSTLHTGSTESPITRSLQEQQQRLKD